VNRLFAIIVALVSFGCAAQAHGDETSIQLKDATQAPQVRARCSICHSADYIQMNSIFMNKAAWEAEVRKMIKVMGAPIPESEVADIVDYLVRNYGVE
jgi:cytochrome c5